MPPARVEPAPFEVAREIVHSVQLGTRKEWDRWQSSGERPPQIPAAPQKVYRNRGWIDWDDWLGVETDAAPTSPPSTVVSNEAGQCSGVSQEEKHRAAQKRYRARKKEEKEKRESIEASTIRDESPPADKRRKVVPEDAYTGPITGDSERSLRRHISAIVAGFEKFNKNVDFQARLLDGVLQHHSLRPAKVSPWKP
jgi:hypothetical protein